MTVDTIIDDAQELCGISSAHVSDARVLRYLNSIYHDAILFIIEHVGEDFFFDIWTTDAVASQTNGEYPYPAQDGTNAGLAKIKGVEVKTRSDADYYTKARQVDPRSLSYTWDWYLTNQPASEPIYFIADKSIFLAPNFTSDTAGDAGNAQIKMLGIKEAVDLATGGTEASVLVPREFHHSVLAVGCKQHIFSYLKKIREKNDAKAEHEANLQRMLSVLTDRDISIGQATMPSGVEFE